MRDRDDWAQRLEWIAVEPSAQPLRISQLCVEGLGVTGAGVSMVSTRGTRGVVCATDAVSARIEDLQVSLGEGPCVDAATTGTAVLVADLASPEDLAVQRWPAFMDGALTSGVRAVFAFPLRIGAIDVGALDLYRDQPGELSEVNLTGALMAADAAAIALMRLDTGDLDTFPDDPEDRMAHQFKVHQATGMVQVQLGVSTEVAFLRLRARAFATGRLLTDIATDVIERRLRFSTEDG